jgi:hypothetical protein
MGLAGDLSTPRPTQDVPRASHLSHAQDPLSSVSPTTPVITPPSTTNKEDIAAHAGSQIQPAAMIVEESYPVQWGAQPTFHTNNVSQHNTNSHILSPFTDNSKDSYPYGQHSISYNTGYDDSYASPYSSSSLPRSFNAMELRSSPHSSSTSEAYPPAAYHIEQPKHYDTASESESNDHLMQMQAQDEYDYYAGRSNSEQDGNYYGAYSNMAYSSGTGSGMSRYGSDMSGDEDIVIDKEQPYAQLIYLALLQADGHTMILRDIYKWFLKNTDKATASKTKGWQNSIRHNLSMNGVRPHPSLPFTPSH